jgi:hypothetical protein
MRQMQARYRGLCGACGGAIAIGTTIARDPATRRVFHLRCAIAPAQSVASIASLGAPADRPDLVLVPLVVPRGSEPPQPGETMLTSVDGPVRVLRAQVLPAPPGQPRLAMVTGRRTATAGPRRRWRDLTDD